MSLIVDTITAYLPSKRKHTPSKWTSFNAVCCQANGNSMDKRQRGGININDDSISYHCFNCGFKTSWQPGRPLSIKFKKLLQWLSVPDDIVTKCTFEALKLKDEISPTQGLALIPKFFDRELPLGARPINEWNVDDLTADEATNFIQVVKYIIDRGFKLEDYNWYWTNEHGFNDRLIVPFYYETRIVGYTARVCKPRKTAKYISEQQPGYVFNLDRQHYDRKFVIVAEGPLDAICVDGVAVMSNEISPQQRHLISRLQREIIVVPDKDQAGLKLVEQAMELGWSVSFPDWNTDIKDINDAVNYYGKLYTLWSIVTSKESMPLKIKLRMKKWI